MTDDEKTWPDRPDAQGSGTWATRSWVQGIPIACDDIGVEPETARIAQVVQRAVEDVVATFARAGVPLHAKIDVEVSASPNDTETIQFTATWNAIAARTDSGSTLEV